jgi:hypothetical protein
MSVVLLRTCSVRGTPSCAIYPRLLRNKKHDRWFALYHGNRRIRIACRYEDLLRECRRLGIGRDAYYIGIIRPHELEPEEIDYLPSEYDEATSREP